MQKVNIDLNEILADKPSNRFIKQFSCFYGDDESILTERIIAWKRIVYAFGKIYGGRDRIFIVRAPGRVNLLGKHSDFQGGRTNGFCLQNEILMVARARDDDLVIIHDLRPHIFPERDFSIEKLMPVEWRGKTWEDYIHFIYPQIKPGDWINYAAGSFLLLQNMFPDKCIKGIEAVTYGNIVLAAGLSSSSALCSASTMGALYANGIDMSEEEISLFSGQAEFYTGSRGGAGDHGIIILTLLDKIVNLRTRPKVEFKYVAFPKNCDIIAIYSGIPSIKTIGRVKSLYNEHSATYQFAVKLLKKRFSKISKIELIADLIDPEIGLTEREIIKFIRALPERISRDNLRIELADEKKWFDQIASTHDNPEDGYAVRKIALYGVTEFSRSRRFPELIERGEIDKLGRLMFISHDGDRVVSHLPEGTVIHFDNEATDEYMDNLLGRANDSLGEYNILPYEPGGYGNSCPELDLIVDICKDTKDVIGATLTGAGFGGHVIALVEKGSADKLFSRLKQDYYGKKNIEFNAYLCSPSAGASLHPLI